MAVLNQLKRSDELDFVLSCIIIATTLSAIVIGSQYYELSIRETEGMQVLASIPVIVIIIMLFVWCLASRNLNYSMTAIVLMSLSAILLGSLSYQELATNYLDECSILTAEYESVQLRDCMSHASVNPDATGAEIIKALTVKTEATHIVADLLKRPLKP